MKSDFFKVQANNFRFALSLLVIFFPNAIVYALQLEDSNAYAGFQPVAFDPEYWMRAICASIVLAALMPRRVHLPSHFFLLLYGIFVPLNYVMFNAVGAYVDTPAFLWRFLVLLLPMLAIRACHQLRIIAAPMPLFRFRHVEKGIAVASLLIALIVLAKGPASAGFGLDDVYERRLDGREIFVAGSALSYMSTIVVNGFTPFLAFMGGVSRRRWLAVMALAMAVVYFYVVGLKSPIAFTALAYVVGLGLARGRGNGVYRPLALALGTAFIAFVAEIVLNKFSLVAEFFFRRVFVVPADVMQNYFDLISRNTSANWSPFTGVNSAPDGVSYLVGRLYYNSDIANVNTNAFVDSLAARGLPGLFLTVCLVCVVTTWADAMYRSAKNPAFMYIGFMYALLLTEQAATTALISSGIGTLAVILSVSFVPKRQLSVAKRLPAQTALPVSHPN